MKHIIFSTLILISLTLIVGQASAQEINKRTKLDAGSQAKVNRVIAEQHITRKSESEKKEKTQGCGVNVGNVDLKKGQRAPREVITVIRGDVISTCR